MIGFEANFLVQSEPKRKESLLSWLLFLTLSSRRRRRSIVIPSVTFFLVYVVVCVCVCSRWHLMTSPIASAIALPGLLEE